MSNPPNNPLNPNPSPEKEPWLYSGAQQPTPVNTTPPPPSETAATPPASPAPARPSYSRPTQPAARPSDGGVRSDDASIASIVDTIEAIIIALILALTFRAFVIEAFVIPTGSMAPTLLGAHFNVTCPECGYTFTRDASLNFQLEGDTIKPFKRGELVSNTNIPCDGDDPATLVCPNCQYNIPYNLLPQYLGTAPNLKDSRRGVERPVPFAWANNGDRILVLKYLYTLMEPTRFDVIVFKEPMQARDNFIKRLIGLPEETIEIIGGDVYIGPPGKHDPDDRLIARKPPHIQKDLWQLVYDNDFYPRDEGPPVRVGATPYSRRSMVQSDSYMRDHYSEWHNPWTGAGPTAAAWNKPNARTADGQPFQTVGGPVIHYTANAAGTLEFNAEHRDPYTYNLLGYNNDIHDLYNPNKVASITLMPVGDLRLETTWTPAAAGGESIALSVGTPDNLFRASWSKDGLELSRFNIDTQKFEAVEKIAAADLPPLTPGKAHNVAFNNVDHSAQFFIDGAMVLAHDRPWSATDALKDDARIQAQLNERRGSRLESLAPRVQIEVGGACTLGHLKLFRDLYYTQTEQQGSVGRYPGAANAHHPLTLGKDEFFALGDNSRRSHDGRTWNEVFPALDDLGTDRGIVPRRYLLGKAVFVYWPAGFRFTDRLPHVPPLVPNTGDMRFIR